MAQGRTNPSKMKGSLKKELDCATIALRLPAFLRVSWSIMERGGLRSHLSFSEFFATLKDS
jgi:hypothetical protein